MNNKKWHRLCENSCGKRVSQAKARFCSQQCNQDDRFALRLKVSLAGLYPPVANTVGFLHRVLAHLHGDGCARCGWAERNPVTGKVPVEVEHIAGNWTNNDPSNRCCSALIATP
jgi:hypothetical protein